MYNFLLDLDYTIFFFINGNLSNPFFDWFMPVLDKPGPYLLPFILLWIYLIFKTKTRKLFILLLVPLTILCVDQTGLAVKKLELRARPWVGQESGMVNHLGGSGGKHKSFPSNHAANAAALAVIFSYLVRKPRCIFWIFAAIVMFSRIYIGVHYPADIIAGGLLGLVISKLIIFAFEKIKLLNKKGG